MTGRDVDTRHEYYTISKVYRCLIKFKESDYRVLRLRLNGKVRVEGDEGKYVRTV